VISGQGVPILLSVARGLGYGLDSAAMEAVGKWRFAPGTKDGQPVNTQIDIEVSFHP
jgi:TonB family protein